MSDKEYKSISEKVYDITNETKKISSDEKKYKVLYKESNSTNGMKAAAVAPVDDNGNVDTSKIIIAYAGTGDLNDVRVDRDEVVFGLKYPGSQIDTSEKFAKKMRQEYPNSDFNFTGHSLGGYLAVHNAAENKSQATVFNAPDASNSMNRDQIDFVLNNPGLIKNYRHPKDIIGNHGGDKLGIAIYVDSDTNGYGIPLISNAFDIGFKYHAIKSWNNFDKDGNLLDKNGNIVRKIDLKELDIDGDGKIDFRLDQKNLEEEPLFSPTFTEKINGGLEIKINYESLKYLSNQLMNAIRDLETALNMLNSAEVYNNELSNKKENRKETLEQYVINHLEQMNVISMIEKLDKLFNDIDDNKEKYSHVGDYNPKTFSIQFHNTGKTMWVEADDHLFNYSSVEGRLVEVVNSSNEVAKSLRRASIVDVIKSHANGPMISLNVRSEMGRAGEGIINSFKDRIRESFKGENNRSGFDDGIVDALKEVIRVEKQNVQTLINCFQYMNSAVQITAYSFNESDTDLGNKLKENQQVVGNYQVPTVTSDYNTFLKQTNVFDDIEVVKAFDKQVDTRTEELSGEMINKLGNYFNSVASRAKDILNKVTENKYYVENVVEKYPIQIYHKTIGSKDKTYYGSVESCISEAASIKEVGEISKGIEEKHSRLLPDIENVLLNLPRLNQSLKGSLEELIYGYDNLSGILKAHNSVNDILNKINRQASGFNSLLKENRGQTINKATVRLEEVINTTNNVNTMIEDCFGGH
ncbi:SA1320 family protein [Gemella sanguinis]|uniref:DUF2974 domain-containing protein n=1 Tax=Gemella sanguinis TaxID=84135 RepID=A0A2N6SER6_9BACL|nr:hypothetical protein [Gemella sanguinis]PMC52434.1 hypothetical protein CJ218_04745 [Gemella sanguinis]